MGLGFDFLHAVGQRLRRHGYSSSVRSSKRARRTLRCEPLDERQLLAITVESLTPTTSVFVVEFSDAVETSTLNLYDAENGALGEADVTLEGATVGSVCGSLVVEDSELTFVPGGGSASISGGLLAQETNTGRYERDDFSVLSEIGLKLGCDISCRLRATLGYSFFYWPDVARPGDQVDLNVSQLPPESATGANCPEFSFLRNGFWAQGLQFGLAYRF